MFLFAIPSQIFGQKLGLDDVIREVCTNKGFKCVRGDETYFKGDIFSQMLKLIVKSNLIIANINGRKPRTRDIIKSKSSV